MKRVGSNDTSDTRFSAGDAAHYPSNRDLPFWRILKRTGHSGWWSLLVLIPVVNLCSLWLFAFVRWPATDKNVS